MTETLKHIKENYFINQTYTILESLLFFFTGLMIGGGNSLIGGMLLIAVTCSLGYRGYRGLLK